MYKLEYIWIDGTELIPQLRSKTKIVKEFDKTLNGPSGCPMWGFDGSSTNQATGDNSDCVLKPVRLYENPLNGYNSYLVLCEVWLPNSQTFIPHETNTRHQLDITLQLTIVLIIMAHAASGANWVLSTVLTQMWVEDEVRGRVFSMDMLILGASAALSTTTAGFLVDYYDLAIKDGMMMFSVVMILTGIIFTLWRPDLKDKRLTQHNAQR